MSESNRVALVTGASRGLGAVIARVLAGRGYDLVIGARESGPLERQAESLRRPGVRVVSIAGDVAEDAVRRTLVEAAGSLGGLDLLVNNASTLGAMGPLADADLSRYMEALNVNSIAPVALIQAALPLLAARRGLIVNVSSDAAAGAYAGWGLYGSSKAALELSTRTFAEELRPYGVSAALVDPGDMRTRMHQEAFPGQDISDRPLPDVTVPFWNWLFDQSHEEIGGRRFSAQQEDARWLQQV